MQASSASCKANQPIISWAHWQITTPKNTHQGVLRIDNLDTSIKQCIVEGKPAKHIVSVLTNLHTKQHTSESLCVSTRHCNIRYFCFENFRLGFLGYFIPGRLWSYGSWAGERVKSALGHTEAGDCRCEHCGIACGTRHVHVRWHNLYVCEQVMLSLADGTYTDCGTTQTRWRVAVLCSLTVRQPLQQATRIPSTRCVWIHP